MEPGYRGNDTWSWDSVKTEDIRITMHCISWSCTFRIILMCCFNVFCFLHCFTLYQSSTEMLFPADRWETDLFYPWMIDVGCIVVDEQGIGDFERVLSECCELGEALELKVGGRELISSRTNQFCIAPSKLPTYPLQSCTLCFDKTVPLRRRLQWTITRSNVAYYMSFYQT